MTHFCSPELSKRLADLGVVSQFDFWYLVNGACVHDPEYGRTQKAIHWSDLLLPKNVKKVWGDKENFYQATPVHKHIGEMLTDWEYYTRNLLSIIQSNGDWEKYIKETMI